MPVGEKYLLFKCVHLFPYRNIPQHSGEGTSSIMTA
jgi:hypothetical protein